MNEDRTCSACGGELADIALWLNMAESARVYPGVACRVITSCPSCDAVFEQWATDGAPRVQVTDPNEADLLRRYVLKG